MAKFRFNSLLEEAGLRPEDVSVILHTTNLQPLRRMLPHIVVERPELFEAYQSVHSDQATATLLGRQYAASFVPAENGKMTFAGLYRIAGAAKRSVGEIYNDERYGVLEVEYGATDTAPQKHIDKGGEQVQFTLELMEKLGHFRGCIQILAPEGRTYVRIAANLDAQVVVLSQESLLVAPAPDWDQFIATGSMVRALPPSWAGRLREWRGIYLITDESDGARYVGSAYGQSNLLGRWCEHVAKDEGVTKELSKRDPLNFRFSILQLLAQDEEAEKVIAVEQNWMKRLHTLRFGLNYDGT